LALRRPLATFQCNMINITPQQLRKAANIQEKIQALQKELGQILGSEPTTPAPTTQAPTKERKKYRMSAAGRARIAAAVKARWAKVRGTAPSAMAVQKPKKKFSAAARAALSAAIKARWAKAKKAGKSTL
jgi:hypothetical protein